MLLFLNPASRPLTPRVGKGAVVTFSTLWQPSWYFAFWLFLLPLLKGTQEVPQPLGMLWHWQGQQCGPAKEVAPSFFSA